MKLSDLPAELHKDNNAVLTVLARTRRFSVFDLTTDALAETVGRLHATGWIKYVASAFPHQYVQIKGLA